MSGGNIPKIEIAERISKILFGTVLTGALAVFSTKVSYGVKWEELTLKRGAACYESARELNKAMTEYDSQEIKKTVKRWFDAICDNKEDKETEVTQEIKTALELLEDSENKSEKKPAKSSKAKDQFVVLGEKTGANGYFNFDGTTAGVLTDLSRVKSGTHLYARFGVNVRTNTDKTVNNRNPIQYTLRKNACVKALGEVRQLRGLYWLQIEQSDKCNSV